jgi:SAM-dependent methyltransferase
VEVADVELLRSPAARELLAGLPRYSDDTALATGERLRAAGHDPALVAAVLTQARLRDKARPRWGDVVDRLVLSPDGAEQGTRPVVADHRALRYAEAGVTSVLDLGCGLGLDAMAFAGAGIRTLAVERDPATAAAAAANAETAGHAHRLRVVCADALMLDLADVAPDAEAAFADPARRRDGRRLRHPEQWSPPLSWLLSLPFEAMGVKVAPGLDRATVPPATEFEVVSVGGDVVEAGLYRGALRRDDVQLRATLLPSGLTVTDRDLPNGPTPVGAVGRFLHEPDGAVVRSGLVEVVVAELDGRLLDPTIAYVTTDSAARSPFATAYEVSDVMTFSLKRLRALLRDRGVGRVTIKKRGSALDPEMLRRQLRLDRSARGETTIFLTRRAGAPVVVLADPLAK